MCNKQAVEATSILHSYILISERIDSELSYVSSCRFLTLKRSWPILRYLNHLTELVKIIIWKLLSSVM
jgi:hypothetical protein